MGRWHCIDPKSETYYPLSGYNFVSNNPIKIIDPNGEGAPLIIVAGVAIGVTEVALISAGIITTGFIVHQAQNGAFEINTNVSDYFARWDPRIEHQNKREKQSEQETRDIKLRHNKSVENSGMDKRGSANGKWNPNVKNSTKAGAAALGTYLLYDKYKKTLEETEKEITKAKETKEQNEQKKEQNQQKTEEKDHLELKYEFQRDIQNN